MPQLPKHGWIHRCACCETITSRTMSVTSPRKASCASICLTCRPLCLETLNMDYKVVRIIRETIGHIAVQVTHECIKR